MNSNESPTEPLPDPHGLQDDEQLRSIFERAASANLEAWWTHDIELSSKKPLEIMGLRIDFPAGRTKRRVYLSPDSARRMATLKFEQWKFLGDYEAMLDSASNKIYAGIDVRFNGTGLESIPGAQIKSWEDVEVLDEDSPISAYRKPASLLLSNPEQNLAIELTSPPPLSIQIASFSSTERYGLVVHGVTATRHDEALRLLIRLTDSLFFDLDVSHNLTARLSKDYGSSASLDEEDDQEHVARATPRFPTILHNHDSVELYLYARTLSQVPFLEYLAYYQIIEFYLPTYSRAASIQKLRKTLKDPRFDAADDTALGRIVDTLAQGGRTTRTEREQVEVTLLACVDNETLETYLNEHPVCTKALGDKTRITGVRPINMRDQQMSPVSQVADRVYSLRCRIVHAKEGGNGHGEPLRPFGRESELLRHDLRLIRFLAQQVMITSSRSASWT